MTLNLITRVAWQGQLPTLARWMNPYVNERAAVIVQIAHALLQCVDVSEQPVRKQIRWMVVCLIGSVMWIVNSVMQRVWQHPVSTAPKTFMQEFFDTLEECQQSVLQVPGIEDVAVVSDVLLEESRHVTDRATRAMIDVYLGTQLVGQGEDEQAFRAALIQSRSIEQWDQIPKISDLFFEHVGPHLSFYSWCIAKVKWRCVEGLVIPILNHGVAFVIDMLRTKILTTNMSAQYTLMNGVLQTFESWLLDRASLTEQPVHEEDLSGSYTRYGIQKMIGFYAWMQKQLVDMHLCAPTQQAAQVELSVGQRYLHQACHDLIATVLHAYIDRYAFWKKGFNIPVLGAILHDIDAAFEEFLCRPFIAWLGHLLYQRCVENAENRVVFLSEKLVNLIDLPEDLGSFLEEDVRFVNLVIQMEACAQTLMQIVFDDTKENADVWMGFKEMFGDEAIGKLVASITRQCMLVMRAESIEEKCAQLIHCWIQSQAPLHNIESNEPPHLSAKQAIIQAVNRSMTKLYARLRTCDEERIQDLFDLAHRDHYSKVVKRIDRLQGLCEQDRFLDELQLVYTWMKIAKKFHANIVTLPEIQRQCVAERYLPIYRRVRDYAVVVRHVHQFYQNLHQRQNDKEKILDFFKYQRYVSPPLPTAELKVHVDKVKAFLPHVHHEQLYARLDGFANHTEWEDNSRQGTWRELVSTVRAAVDLEMSKQQQHCMENLTRRQSILMELQREKQWIQGSLSTRQQDLVRKNFKEERLLFEEQGQRFWQWLQPDLGETLVRRFDYLGLAADEEIHVPESLCVTIGRILHAVRCQLS